MLANPRPESAAVPLYAPAVLGFWHLTSLDAPTVAVVWALGFAWAAGVRLPAWVPALLALVCWAVYIGDRLLDARAALRSGQTSSLRERHLFHWRHRRILAPLAAFSAGAAVWIVAAVMPIVARERNSVLAAAALVYFARVHSKAHLAPDAQLPSLGQAEFQFRFPAIFPAGFPVKEMLVGILFTTACVLPSWFHAVAASSSLIAPAIFFAALAWLNCHLIESWESDAVSFEFAPGLLGVAGQVLAAVLAASQPRTAALLAAGAASALLLALLNRLRSNLTPLALRATADLVLLTPLVLLLR
jgi:hypothetical protein